MIRMICIVYLLLISLSSIAKIYSWVDEKGVRHYSSHAKSADAKEVNVDVPDSNWQKMDIKIIDIGFDLTDQEHQRIQRDVNTVYQFFDKKLFFDIYKTVPVSIRIFGSKEDYVNYNLRHQDLSAQSKSTTVHTLGRYLPKTNEILVYQHKNRDRTFSTIKHEVSHAITDTLTPFVPSWLNEGVAENMETIGIQKDSLFIGSHRTNLYNLRRYDSDDKLLAIKDFMSLTSRDWRKQNRNTDYALQIQAGEFTRMLLSSPTGLNFISRLMHNYKRGDRTIAYYLVDDEYFGGLGTLESKWSLWVKRKESGQFAL
ncbi:DUF4124 domain-containing protein [Endozoicomonas arenosclerae]|uniref:DUF4124 domain-containing protein n=1 Tax=Endozoicomonas arenosclerae TaxID=1633495 RepID=UPI0009A1DFEB|nr:DUF4124 domain-containing protein [Endozoicomonas arenosclerae]